MLNQLANNFGNPYSFLCRWHSFSHIALLVLNLTVAFGTPNGIIFYANVVASSGLVAPSYHFQPLITHSIVEIPTFHKCGTKK